MEFSTPSEVAVSLLGRTPERMSTLVAWPHHGAYRVDIAGESFVVKIDADDESIAREVAGHQRAESAGVPVPELIAANEHGIATRFVVGVPLHESSTAAAWRAAGRALRRVHDLAPGDPIADDFGFGFGYGLPCSTWPEFVAALLARELDGCVRDLGFDPMQAERIRRAFDDAAALVDQRAPAWCHGDCQPEHVIVDPDDDSVCAIIDWADHGRGDAAWDLAVLSLDDTTCVEALLDGHGEAAGDDGARTVLGLYRVLRWLSEARWLAARSHPCASVSLEHAARWSPSR